MLYGQFCVSVPSTSESEGAALAATRNKFIICTRDTDENGKLLDEPGQTRYLRVPFGTATYDTSHDLRSAERWRLAVQAAATGEKDAITDSTGEVLLFVHGYNNDIATISWRTEMLQTSLEQQGWRGVVVAFDWPSDNSTLNYLEDRYDASQVAERLVTC